MKNRLSENCVIQDGKEVIIAWPADMSEEDYEDFTDWIIFLHRRIGRSIVSDKKLSLMKSEDANEN